MFMYICMYMYVMLVFNSVELDASSQSDGGYGFELKGPQNASLYFVAISQGSIDGNKALAIRWVAALTTCIQMALSQANRS